MLTRPDRATIVTLLDRTFAKRAALMWTTVVHGSEFPVYIGECH